MWGELTLYFGPRDARPSTPERQPVGIALDSGYPEAKRSATCPKRSRHGYASGSRNRILRVLRSTTAQTLSEDSHTGRGLARWDDHHRVLDISRCYVGALLPFRGYEQLPAMAFRGGRRMDGPHSAFEPPGHRLCTPLRRC